MLVGFALFAGAYVGSALSYAISPSVFDSKLLIPLAGPWLSLDAVDRASVPDAERTVDKATLVFQGLLQAAGLIVSMVGASLYAASGPADSAGGPRNLSFQFVPTPGGAFGGMQGRF